MSRQQIVNELHKPARKNFARRHVILKGIDDLWQSDLVDMQEFADLNKNFNYILTVIDCFSKYAWAIPLKNKTGPLVTKSMETIFQQSKRIPKNLQTDMGTEFYNTNFKELMKKFKINHYSSYSFLKASIVERFNRTLKGRMWKQFSFQGSYKWLDQIDDLVKQYNTTTHRTIKMAPVAVHSKRIQTHLLNTVYNYKKQLIKSKFNIGDHVRISRHKKTFEKGYETNWSPEIFKIAKVSRKFPVTYLIEDYQKHNIKGRFYEQELQKVKDPNAYLVEKVIKRDRDRAYIKWIGFDSTHNSWIPESDII